MSPKFVILTHDGFVEPGIEEPGQPVFISIEVPANFFHKNAEYRYKETNDLEDPFRRGKTLWEVAMQCRIAQEIRIFTDDVESGLFVAANFQNDPTFPFLFGKLVPNEFHDRVMEVFTAHCQAP
jgi:hypothetical protein